MSIQDHQIVPLREIVVDVRSTSQKIGAFLKDPTNLGVSLIITAVISLLVPPISDFLVITSALICYLYGRRTYYDLPMEVPQWLEKPDRSSPSHESPGKYQEGKAIMYFGTAHSGSGRAQVWASNDVIRTHIMVFGATGSGKSEALLSFAYNALVWGSGFIFCDGKGTPKLYAQIYALARYLGREDDVRLLNYMLGPFNPQSKTPIRISNTLSLLSSGSASFLAETLVSLMPDASGDGGMWKDRAVNLVNSVMSVIAIFRDEQIVNVTPGIVRDYFVFNNLLMLATHNDELRKSNNTASMLCSKYNRLIPLFPQYVEDGLKAYFDNIPGFSWQSGTKQSGKCLEQHGFLQMQFTKILGNLSDIYGHIFNVELSDIDMIDVVLNNRILCILLPSLEKSEHETRSLGNLSLRLTKGMMSMVMGANVEGPYKDTIETLAANAPYPMIGIFDEVSYYLVKGTAVMPAQGRGLGMCLIFAAQDKPGLISGAGEQEADSMMGNTKVKVFMALEDSGKTWDEARNAAGQVYVALTEGKEVREGFFNTRYIRSKHVRFEKQDRISLQELKNQRSGDAVIIWRDRVIRSKIMYSNIKPKFTQVNTLLQIRRPKVEDIKSRTKEALEAKKRKAHLTNELLRLCKNLPLESNPILDEIPWLSQWKHTHDALSQSHDTKRIQSTEKNIIALVRAIQLLECPSQMEQTVTGQLPEEQTLGQQGSFSTKSSEQQIVGPIETLSKEEECNVQSQQRSPVVEQTRDVIAAGIKTIEEALGKTPEEAEEVVRVAQFNINQKLVPILEKMGDYDIESEEIVFIFDKLRRELSSLEET